MENKEDLNLILELIIVILLAFDVYFTWLMLRRGH